MLYEIVMVYLYVTSLLLFFAIPVIAKHGPYPNVTTVSCSLVVFRFYLLWLPLFIVAILAALDQAVFGD